MNSCFILTIYECRVSCLLIFQNERNFIDVLFSEVLSYSLFHLCSLQMRYVSVKTASSIFTTNVSVQRRILML
jgi:hypothetical protein